MKKRNLLLIPAALLLFGAASCQSDNQAGSSSGFAEQYETTIEVGQPIIESEFGIFEVTSVEIHTYYYDIVVECTNKVDYPLSFDIRNIAIDGYTMNIATTYINVPANGTSSEKITIDNPVSLNIDEIVLDLSICNDNYQTVYSGINTIYPTGKNSSSVQYPPRKTNANEKVICDNEFSTFIILQTEYDNLNKGIAVYYYAENKTTDFDCTFHLDDFYANGNVKLTSWSIFTALPKTRVYGRFIITDKELNEASVSNLNEIKFSFGQYECNSIGDDTLIFKTDACTYSIK